MVKETLSARVSQATFRELEEYAEERGMSKSEATDRLVEKGLKVEDKDILIVSTDGGTQIENQLTKTQNQLQNQSEQIQNQSEQIEQQETTQKYLSIALIVSVLWLGSHIVLPVPSDVTVYSGVVLLIGLVSAYLRYLWE